MGDIRRWLNSIGHSQYAEAFEANAIEGTTLPALDHDLLKELGVKAVGHRVAILRAIQSLDFTSEHAASSVASQLSFAGKAERRQITVMFCDLVGSVALGEQMDVEDYRDLLARFRDTVVGALQCYDGFVARHQGDALLVYFGFPQAHEDDAERGVRAGLEVVQAVETLGHPYDGQLKVRVGIATGPAVVGDVLATGASECSELAALGPTPNLAARLQGKAAANTVLISATTARLIAGRLETTPMPAFDLKGIDTPVVAFRVLAKKGAQTRSEALEPTRLSSLVGRQGELALVLDRWKQVKGGAGQAVLIFAEPGVGKTRLIHELREQLQGEVRTITLYSSPYHMGSTLHPVIEALCRALDVEREDTPEGRRKALESWLRSVHLADDYLPLLATLLSLPLGEGYAPLKLPPDELKRQTLEMLAGLIEALAGRQPVLLIVEDLHWVDPTTMELLGLMLERIRHARVLVLLACRPELQSPWSGQPHLTHLTLNHLTQAESRQLANLVTRERALSEAVITRIIERADGVPLFVEELSRTVLESGEDDTMDQWVPDTLRDALTARLDRLGPAKAVAQCAAVIGRQFRLDWLEAVTSINKSEIHSSLEHLVSSGLANRRGSSAIAYEFKHALVRDTAYDSLLREERERLHARFACALADSLDRIDTPPELVAFHYSRAGDLQHAVPYWQHAGQLAAQRDAQEEAVKHFSDALSYLENKSEESHRVLDIVIGLANAMHWAGDRQRASELLLRYKSLPSKIEDALLTSQYYSIMGLVRAFFGERKAAKENLEQALDAARRTGNHIFTAEAQSFLAAEEAFAEDYRNAVRRAEDALAVLVHQEASGAMSVACWSAGFAHFNLGNFEQARRISKQCSALGQVAKRRSMLAHAAWVLSAVCLESGDLDEALATINKAIAEGLSPFDEALLFPELGKAHLEAGDIEFAIPLLEEGLGKARQYRSRQVQVWAELALARAYLQDDRLERAEALTHGALRAARELECSRAQARWVAGLVAQKQGEITHATEYFEEAIKELSNLGARPLQARVHIAAATLAHQSGEVHQASRHLRGAYSLYEKLEIHYHIRSVQNLAEVYGVNMAA